MSDLDPDARRLVNLARRARTPGEADKSRIAERLALPLVAGAAAGAAVGTAKAATSGAVTSGAVTSGAATTGIGVQATGTTLLSSVGAKIAAVIAAGAVGTAVVVSQLSPAPPVAPVAPSAQQTPAPREPVPTLQGAPEVNEVEEAVEAAPRPSPRAPKALSKPSSVSSANPTNELAQEAALLHRAQSAWRAGQSTEALRLANQHAEQFPRSQLANERDVLRVLSLCKLGQTDAAKSVGARLLGKEKGSPWYQSVAGSCIGK